MRDDQKVASRENLCHHKILTGAFHGENGGTKFLEDSANSVLLRNTRRGTEEKNKKLQSNRVNVGDVEVVRSVYFSSSGKKKNSLKAADSYT